MKVLQINTVCGTGSTGRIATDIHKILIEGGHESFIAYGRGEARGIDEKFTIKIGSKLDNYLHVAKTRIFDKHGLASVKATKEFIKKIEKLNPGVIHLHNIHGYYLNYQLLFEYLKKSQKKIIWTLHDCWTFTGHCSHYDYIDCQKWQTECSDCRQKNEYPKSMLFDNSKENFKLKKESFLGIDDLTIVAPSQWLANEIKKSFLKDYEIKVINNGIDLDVFKPTKSDFRKKYDLDEKFIILGVASPWGKRKGFKYFIELSQRLAEDEVIVMVGVTEKQIKKLPENIIGIERTNSQKELAQIYTAADVFINPTLEEVLGLTNIEASACKTPGITFKSGGSSECFDKKTGIIVEKENLKDLYEAIKKIKKDGKMKYSEECRRRVERLYSKDEKFRAYVEKYKECKRS